MTETRERLLVIELEESNQPELNLLRVSRNSVTPSERLKGCQLSEAYTCVWVFFTVDTRVKAIRIH